MKTKISASILSADFGKLNNEILSIEKHADLLHVDVMDGHFVDNLTIGPVVLKHIKTKLPIDVHLMISQPLKYAKEFSKYCDMISFHASLFNKNDLIKSVKEIKKLKVKVGLVLNPDDSLKLIESVLDEVDFILIMSVYAGFGGQKFIPSVLEKIKQLRKKGFKKDIEIDGGINDKTIKKAYESGANVFVSGSYIFNSKNRKKSIEKLRSELL